MLVPISKKLREKAAYLLNGDSQEQGQQFVFRLETAPSYDIPQLGGPALKPQRPEDLRPWGPPSAHGVGEERDILDEGGPSGVFTPLGNTGQDWKPMAPPVKDTVERAEGVDTYQGGLPQEGTAPEVQQNLRGSGAPKKQR